MSERTILGVKPWLPWPLSQWRSWTEPARAESLAALRIGVAAVLTLDILCSYLPRVHDFFGPDSLSRIGERDVFAWYARAPHYNWSLLRGLGHPLNLGFFLALWVGLSLWLLLGLGTRLAARAPKKDPVSFRWATVLWVPATVLALFGLWARLRTLPEVKPSASADLHEIAGSMIWYTALVPWVVASLGLVLALWGRLRGSAGSDRLLLPLVALAWVVATGLLVLAWYRSQVEVLDDTHPLSLYWALTSWDEHPDALRAAMVVWVVSTVCLMIGIWTRLSAVAVWVLSTSFANLNSYVDNAGDTVRGILLFYLMICPCGAVWSVDSRLAGRGRAGPVYIYPWIYRLLFLQLIITYFFNGIYKLFGEEWRHGYSLYYVLADLALTRVSYAEFHLPVDVIQIACYSVLVWEVSIPLLVIHRWTRVPALWFGVAFHLGIWVSMELGSFVPYMLCLYVPLLPWHRWADRWNARSPPLAA
jgi:hypothetical protein